MKVAFWSNTQGRGGTTSNMACISIVHSIMNQDTSILFENHCSLNGLDNALTSRRWNSMVMEELYSYGHAGIDGLMKRIHSNMMSGEMVKSASVELMNGQVYYIPQSRLGNKEFFEYELSQVIHRLMAVLEESCDIVFIDTAGKHHLSAKLILDEADIVVVNLSQEPSLLQDYFLNYQSLADKAVYLIGNYNPQSKSNLKNIIRKYSINKDLISVIPYCIDFKDALADGTVIRFLMRTYGCRRENENYYFISQAAKAAAMLKRRIEKIRKEKEIAV